MASSDRRKRERDALRARILATARQLILEEGYEGLTIRKIAEKIEYSPMALYSHFADKRTLLLALASESFAQFLTIKPKPGGDSVAMLKKSLLLYISHWVARPDEYRLMFMSRPVETTDAAEAACDDTAISNEDGGRDAFEVLVNYVHACIAEHKMEGDPFSLARLLWTGVHGAVALQIALPHFPFGDRVRYAEDLVDVLVRGLQST